MKKYCLIMLAAVCIITGCTNPLDSYIDKPADGAPGALLNVTAEPGMGMVTFRWQNPDNYYYTDISYTDINGNNVKKLASKYSVDETLGEGYSCFVFAGFNVSGEYTFTLVPYSASGKAGPSSIIKCTPQDKSDVYKFILETLTVEPAPLGAYVSWKNEWEAMVSFTISFIDQDNNSKVIKVEETDKSQRIYVGSFDKETELTIVAYNSLGNASDPYVVKVIPIEVSTDVPSLGWFLNKDGSLTAEKQPAGDKESYAVIAYVGSVEHYFSHFIAIALNDCTEDGSDGPAKMAYADGMKAVDLFASKHPVTINGVTYNTNTSGENPYDVVAIGKTTSSATRTGDAETGWRMPSVTDWRYIFEGLTASNEEGARASATDPIGVQNMTYNNIPNSEGAILKAAINKACGNEGLSAFYWVNSDHSGKPVNSWNYRFDMDLWGLLAKTNGAPYVRAVFAY